MMTIMCRDSRDVSFLFYFLVAGFPMSGICISSFKSQISPLGKIFKSMCCWGNIVICNFALKYIVNPYDIYDVFGIYKNTT